MNKIILLASFSVLLLVPLGTQNVFGVENLFPSDFDGSTITVFPGELINVRLGGAATGTCPPVTAGQFAELTLSAGVQVMFDNVAHVTGLGAPNDCSEHSFLAPVAPGTYQLANGVNVINLEVPDLGVFCPGGSIPFTFEGTTKKLCTLAGDPIPQSELFCRSFDGSPFPGSSEFREAPLAGSCFTSVPIEALHPAPTFPPPSNTCGPKTIDVGGICFPNVFEVCGTGTIPDENAYMCFEAMGAVGGVLVDIDTWALLVANIGVNPVITALVGLTLAGVAGQVVWFVHTKRNSKIIKS